MFSFLSETTGAYGIACYENEKDYMEARKYAKRDKPEPKRYLQTGYIALWDDRDTLQKESYDTIKALGFHFRGKGAWLHVERYEIGYYPKQLTEKEIDFLLEAFGNLFMMVAAIYEQGLNPEFDKRKTLLRWYDSSVDLFYTHPFKVDIPIDIAVHPKVFPQISSSALKLKSMPRLDYSMELDISYLSMTIFHEGQETIPLLVLGVEKSKGIIMLNETVHPAADKINVLINCIGNTIKRYGKMSEIFVCDDDVKNIISDFCSKIGIKVTKTNKMSNLKKARNQLISVLK
ncbi:MAG: hypothetical protein II984_06820 [Clostridia bacterium]|nr:hypothetical protein [Clostridia bacterium]